MNFKKYTSQYKVKCSEIYTQIPLPKLKKGQVPPGGRLLRKARLRKKRQRWLDAHNPYSYDKIIEVAKKIQKIMEQRICKELLETSEEKSLMTIGVRCVAPLTQHSTTNVSL